VKIFSHCNPNFKTFCLHKWPTLCKCSHRASHYWPSRVYTVCIPLPNRCQSASFGGRCYQILAVQHI